MCRGVLNDYVYPSLDTTIHSISTGLRLFGENPDQWAKVRADRSRLKSAVLEIVRLSTPIQYFTRVVTKDVEIGGVTLPAGSWVLVMFGSANRDEREFPEPDRFDIERNPAQMVGWGAGKHASRLIQRLVGQLEPEQGRGLRLDIHRLCRVRRGVTP
jgi:cytochrome P450